ncbi:hypothetical protein ALP75_204898 [Pseudomonas syringae pv. actinidiae]|nr:hypothetical protein ALP75_204898 [Pseudomonas syringae pv. actinidiae]
MFGDAANGVHHRLNLLPLLTHPTEGRGRFGQALVELLDAVGGAQAVLAALLGDSTGMPRALRCLLTASGHALRRRRQLGRRRRDLTDLVLLVFDLGQRPAGLSIEGQHGIADPHRLLIDAQQAGAQLHNRNVQRPADGGKLVAPLYRHFDTQVAVTQRLGEGGNATGAVANGRLQAREQINCHGHQNAEDHRQRDELHVGGFMVVVEAPVKRVKRLLAQVRRTAGQSIDTLFKLFRLELDAPAENAVINHLQLGFQHLFCGSVFVRPRLQLFGKLGEQQACRLVHLLLGIVDTATQITHLQTALQAELPRRHRRLSDTGQATDTLDQVWHLLGGKLHEHVGFKPGVENQPAVHGDLFAQCLDQIQHRREPLVAIRPPANGAQRCSVQAGNCRLQRLETIHCVCRCAFTDQRRIDALKRFGDARDASIDIGHRFFGSRGWLAQDIGGFPAGRVIALSGQFNVEVVERQQLTHA